MNTILEILSTYGLLGKIQIQGTKLIYQGNVLDLKNLNINYFLEQNPNFIRDLPNMTPEAVFNIIKIHATYANGEKEQKEKKAKEYIETTPILKPFSIVKRTDNERVEHSYIHYVDNNGVNHIIAGLSYEDLLLAYKELIMSDSMVKTDKEVFEILKTKGQEIKLEDINEAKQRVDVSESHINNLQKLDSDNNKAMEMSINIVGNEDHNIYINNGHVVTIDQERNGTAVLEKHDTTTGPEDSVVIQDKIELISFSEYVKIIMNKETLSGEEKDKVDNYEAFLFDVITYKDYLTPELQEIYQKWMDLYQKLYYTPVMTPVIEETLKNYASMQERSNNVEITNAREEVMKLSRKNPDQNRTGYVSVIVYIFLTILVGTVIATLVLVSP